jgi:hypothetical protein
MSQPFQFLPPSFVGICFVFLALFAASVSDLRGQSFLPAGFLSRFNFPGNHLLHIATDPFLSRLNRAHHGMMDVLKMLGGMFILGRIAASHFAAHHAHAQVNPVVAHLDAFFAYVHLGGRNFNLIQMLAFPRHVSSP